MSSFRGLPPPDPMRTIILFPATPLNLSTVKSLRIYKGSVLVEKYSYVFKRQGVWQSISDELLLIVVLNRSLKCKQPNYRWNVLKASQSKWSTDLDVVFRPKGIFLMTKSNWIWINVHAMKLVIIATILYI